MNFQTPNPARPARAAGFSLIELLTVIAIISILMTVGAIGIGSILGGKSTTSAVTTVESLFDEARSTAVGKRTKTRILVDISDPKNQATYLRRVLIAYEELDDNGDPKTDSWTLANRGVVLPDQTFFSRDFSKKNQESGAELQEMSLSNVGRDFVGSYLYYEFNGEGICSTPGASFIVGTGAREIGAAKPRVTGSAKRDFGGFVVWRNGRTSLFRSPDQMNLPKDVVNF
jgi:prepilin-type N-terminal cleavage/methylation domain-containing protein